MKGYWFMKYPEHGNKTTKSPIKFSHPFHSQDSGIIDQTSMLGQKEKVIQKMKKFSQKLSQAVGEMISLDQFYSQCSSQEYSEISLKCFHHKSEIIMYCSQDYKLVCPNCIYGQERSRSKTPKKQDQKSIKKLKDSKVSGGQEKSDRKTVNYQRHSLQQLSKTINEVDENIKRWNFSMKAEINDLNVKAKKWADAKKQYQTFRDHIFQQLDKQQDILQAQLCKKYLSAKQEIATLIEPYELIFESVPEAYRMARKLLIPSRYPIPNLKHLWFQEVETMIKNFPVDTLNWDKQFLIVIRNKLTALIKNFSASFHK